MVKVNHGWQSNSIDEVESLASQAGSPTSSTSTLHGRRNLITSPRTAIANVQGQNAHVSQNHNSVAHPAPADFDLYPRTEQQSRTYESFWRDHSSANSIPSVRHHTQSSSFTSPPTSRGPLAPPADIRPTPQSRRSDTPKFSKPPTMPGQHNSSHISTPRTPNRGGNSFSDAVMQTPTQKTIQEQDAIETLLFMSSPGNSGNMGHAFRNHGSPQASPLRAEFSPQIGSASGRRVAFEKIGPVSTGRSEARGYNHGRSKMHEKSPGGEKSKHDAIDRLLDEMGDSSSDDEELVLNYTSPRRSIAAGRV